MQDNDPRHTSRQAATFFNKEGMNWWKTPPESPDLNPIENMCHELKEFIRHEVKPHNKAELIVEPLWDMVDLRKCNKYIDHLRKVKFPELLTLKELLYTGY